MRFLALSDQNGSWAALKDGWRTQCDTFGEDFADYAVGTFAVLDPLAAEGHPRCGIFAFGREAAGPLDAICQVNRTWLPGYDGQVLRTRFITYAPKYDFGELDEHSYAFVLTGIFMMTLGLSEGQILPGMEAKYLKFHLRSPADRQFFSALQTPLSNVDRFERVAVTGSWLYVTKA